jgi:predicted ester cyclase
MTGSTALAISVLMVFLIVTGSSNAAATQPLNKENFHEYLTALENVDADVLTARFYHEDFVIRQGDSTMDLAGLLAFEKSMKSLADFSFDVQQIVADESGIAMDAIETFDVLRDGNLPNIGPARKGERWAVHLNVFYSLKDGRISEIKANVLSVTQLQ